ncbi:DUF5134 domain-containing protein [Streptomyces sp. OF3]|uniref:DUF5134 domain-containing protein n=1 Tax=Streptomyces alkaliterrae TaxID=2213162 RepID=A0A7W3WJU0_9ACTN|nr:DUF5134 domain-containing protein [Streptomyces alkaliterrae]
MHGSAWSGWLLTGLCGLASAVCFVRARASASGPRGRQSPLLEALMGGGMALMALPAPAVPATFLLVLFAGALLWSAALLLRRVPHQGHHLVEGGAMVYMTVLMLDSPGEHGTTGEVAGGHAAHGEPVAHATAGVPSPSVFLAVYFLLYALLAARRLLPARVPHGAHHGAPTAPGPPPLGADSPEVAAACRLALALGMAAMLIAM